MTIETMKDPRTRKETTVISGIVGGVYFNELKQVKTYAGAQGKQWTPTASVAIIVDGDKINLGLTDKDNLRVKDINDTYQDVVVGTEVSVVINDIGEYNGKPQYNAYSSGVTVLAIAAPSEKPRVPVAQASAIRESYAGKKDYSGVQIGHAITAAFNYLGYEASIDSVREAAKALHDITNRVKESYGATNPTLKEYDVGAASGHSVLHAAHIARVRGLAITYVYGLATAILKGLVGDVGAYVRGEAETSVSAPVATPAEADPFVQPVEAPTETPAAVGAPTRRGRPAKTAQAAATASQAAPEGFEPMGGGVLDGMDDSVPF